VRIDPPGGNPEQPDELARLPHGRHGLPPEFVAHNQRERLIASLAHTVAEVGYNNTTITRIVEGASVSSRTFYKYFQTVEECYLGALDAIAARLTPVLTQAYQSEESWPTSVRASIAAALRFFAAEPELARLCTVEPFVGGPAIARRYEEGVAVLVPYLRRGRELREDGDLFPETTERGLLGSMNSLVARKVAGGEAESLPELLPDLVQFALTPYLGAGKARQIATADAR
jgi:AcrR family transcriptional regulator